MTDAASLAVSEPVGFTSPSSDKPAKRFPTHRATPVDDAKIREGLNLIDAGAISDAFIDIDRADLEYAANKKHIIEVILAFEVTGFAYYPDEDLICDPISVEAATLFLSALPKTFKLPQVIPDGDGGVTLVWKDKQSEIAMTIAGLELHAVVDPSKSATQFLPVLPFDGERIPSPILNYIPLR